MKLWKCIWVSLGVWTSVVVSAGDQVVLLHGLARTEKSMLRLEHVLRNAGYEVFNIGYPSRKAGVEVLARQVRTEVDEVIESARPVHFVTHSMGGILLRQMVALEPLENLGRVVMLSPPNQGSEVVDALGDWKAFAWLNGPAGRELGTGEQALPRRLGAASFELGVITGDRSINWILSCLIPGKDDGKVSVERAKLQGMADFRVIHATHPLIMKNREAIELVLRFLKTGTFEKIGDRRG